MKSTVLMVCCVLLISVGYGDWPAEVICEYSSQMSPTADGNLVVWVDGRSSGNYNILGRFLPDGAELGICSLLGNQNSPAVSGSVVVWQDGRKSNVNDEDIYGYDVVAQQEITICADTNNQQYPDIYGSIVVWQEYCNENWDIYGLHLNTMTKFAICTNSASQLYPAISGHYVVWMDNRSGSGYDIYGIDLDNMAAGDFPVCTAAGDQYYPDIDGMIVVWQDPRNADTGNDIYGYNLSTGLEFPVCVYAERQNFPAVSGDWIVWRDRRNGTANYDIYGYNLKSAAVEPICTMSGHQDTPTVSKQYIFWQYNSIWATPLPSTASITVSYPNGGQMLMAGSSDAITWQTEGDGVNAVKIEYSADGGLTWNTLVGNTSNTGAYDCLIPDGHSLNCMIKVSSATNSAITDTSDAEFTIFRCNATLTADITGDCFVGLADFAAMAAQWLTCGNPFDAGWCNQ